MAGIDPSNDDDLQHQQRFLDLSAEPLQMLMPIQGYEKNPLASLDEAVEPIVEYVPDVKRMAYVAKMKCKNPPPDNLSLDESASIMLYSMEWEPHEQCLNNALNATLRSGNQKKLTPWFRFLKLFLTAFDRLPSSTPSVVYRYIRCDMRAAYQKGSTVTWWGFSSCTATINEQLLGSTGPRTLLMIERTSGKNIRQHSNVQSEDEILLPPGRQFQVTLCFEQPGDLYIIKLMEIEPQYPLLEPVSKNTQRSTKPTNSVTVDVDPKIRRPTTSILSKYTNEKLQQSIDEQKGQSVVKLGGMKLIDDDMKIIDSDLLKTITRLELESNEIRDQGIKYLSQGLRNNNTLTQLRLDHNHITHQGIEHLCNLLQTNEGINRLYLANNQIGDQGIEYLSNALLTNKTLGRLDLENNQITDQGVQYLCNALPTNKTLTHLWLNNNPITDQGIKYLSNVLQTNQTLTSLFLSKIQITHQGLRYLSDVLQNNQTLTSLALDNNRITDEGIDDLMNGLQTNKTLTHLFFKNNSISNQSREILKKLKETNPHLNVYY